MPISIDDVKKIEKNRKEIKKEIYKKIYDSCSKKIKNAVELGHKQTIIRIPQYLLGYPTYDIEKARNYTERQFVRGGFIVHKISAMDLYVSWNIKTSEPSRTVHDYEEDDASLPTLINLKKLASKYKNA